MIYVVLFMAAFALIITALDIQSYARCIWIAQSIKIYSAFVLIALVSYHVAAFEFSFKPYSENDSDFEKHKIDEYLQMLGFPTSNEDTGDLMIMYICYMLVGNFLQFMYEEKYNSQETKDLFDWEGHLKTYKGVLEAYEKIRFDEGYVVYKWLSWWPLFDTLC